jgi:hypothetical protein
MRRAGQNKTRRQIQRLIEARPLKRQGFLSPKKIPALLRGSLGSFRFLPN